MYIIIMEGNSMDGELKVTMILFCISQRGV